MQVAGMFPPSEESLIQAVGAGRGVIAMSVSEEAIRHTLWQAQLSIINYQLSIRLSSDSDK
jgi:hypothetical protein